MFKEDGLAAIAAHGSSERARVRNSFGTTGIPVFEPLSRAS
jgi:hypothetical protein